MSIRSIITAYKARKLARHHALMLSVANEALATMGEVKLGAFPDDGIALTEHYIKYEKVKAVRDNLLNGTYEAPK